MNRIADIFFTFAIVLLLLHLGTTDYLLIFSFAPFLQGEYIVLLGLEISLLNAIALLLSLGAIGKSAQLGFHTWLPDAMEGPTPVSALLHAATMVTAGVFLLLRCSPIFQYAPNILLGITLIGGLTAFFFALVGIFQYDIKRIIAYSTCSQLGYMFLACGLSNYSLAAFHLFNHAFFKALLFLGAGAVIHSLGDEQDIRRLGSLLFFLPFTHLSMLIGSIAILGLPFLAGFYSKDLLLEATFLRCLIDSFFVYTLALLAALFTAIYSLRLLLGVFWCHYFSFTSTFRSFSPSEATPYMCLSLGLLALSSILSGYLFFDLFTGMGNFSWLNSLFTLPQQAITAETAYLSPGVKLLPVIFSLGGGFLAWSLHELQGLGTIQLLVHQQCLPLSPHLGLHLSHLWQRITPFFYNAGYFNSIYNLLGLTGYAVSYRFSSKLMDKGYLEILGPFGTYLFRRHLSLIVLSMPSSLFFNVFFFFLCFCVLVLLFTLSFCQPFLLSSLGIYVLSLLLSFWLLAASANEKK